MIGASIPAAIAERTPTKAWIGLAILMTFYLLSFLDKQMLSLLVNPIGGSLKLSDVDLGFIQGVAFSLTYALGTIGAGYAVDRTSPRLIIFIGVIVWSIASAAGGLSHGYLGLLSSRVLVGLGEGVLAPAAITIIVGMFPRGRLGLAMGTYAVGANIGGVTALLLGSATIGALTANGGMHLGFLGYREPWQGALILTGLPGVALAFLVFGIRPSILRRSTGEPRLGADAEAVTLFGYLGAHRGFFLCHFGAIALLGMMAYTLIAWAPAYFGREFKWSHQEIGLVVAAGVAAGGFGNVLWGYVADTLHRSDALYRVFRVLIVIGTPFAILNFLTPSGTLAIVLFPFTWLLLNSWGSLAGAVQLTIPDSLRGRVTALQNVLLAVLGIGLAPLIVGLVSNDLLGGKQHIGQAVAIVVSVSGLLAALLLTIGREGFRRLADAQKGKEGLLF